MEETQVELEDLNALRAEDLEALREKTKKEAEAQRLSDQEQLDKTKQKMQFLYDLVPYIPFFFNPANGILVAALAFSIATILAAIAPQLLAAAAPVLLYIAAGSLIFAAVTIIPFAIWEGIKHYNEWRLGMEAYKQKIGPKNDFVEDEINNPIQQRGYDTKIVYQKRHTDPNPADNYEGSYDHYLSTLLAPKPEKQTPGTPKDPYPILTAFSKSQLGQWARAHYWQAIIVTLGILFSAALIGLCAGFFLGNPVCFDLLHPVFALFQSIFAAGINGLHLPFLAVFADPAVIEIITAVFITALPLIIADNFRRVIQAITFYHPPAPPNDDQKTGSLDAGVQKSDGDEVNHTFLLDDLKSNADVRTWDYLVSVFDKNGKIHDLDNYDPTEEPTPAENLAKN